MKVLTGYPTRLSLSLLLVLLTPRFTTICGDVLPNCPRHCKCTNARSRSTRLPELGLEPLLKLKCGGRERSLSSFQELDLSSISEYITQLDLSENQVSIIEKAAFSKLTQLKRLDLSHNHLSAVSSSVFEGLDNLERLKLNHNQMTHLKKGIFDNLTSLKQLDVSGNPWFCDCELAWLLDWAHDRSVKLTSAAKCDAPPTWSGQPLRKLRGGLDCSETTPTGIELQPSHSQVVFEGDALSLRCRSPAIGRADSIDWAWEGKPAQRAFEDVSVTSLEPGPTVVESWLRIARLSSEHGGLWTCSQAANRSAAVAVIVISDKTVYCPREPTTDGKGSYPWPRTVAGVTAELPCEGEPPGVRKARRVCVPEGHWSSPDTSGCPFVSETTKILEQFARMNLSLAKGTILESARRLRNFTGDGTQLSDKTDVIFVAKTVENYLSHLPDERDLGSLLVEVVGSTLGAPAEVMRSAQREGRACSRLVRAVETVTENVASIQAHGARIAAEEFRVRRDSFPGLTCTWYSHKGGGGGRLFHCSNGNATALVGAKARVIEASVQVPASLFYQLEAQGVQGTSLARQLTVAMFESAGVFPTMTSRDETVTSAVVGVRLVGVTASGLSDPVYVVLRAPRAGSGPPRPVWWDGAGGWSSQGCQLSYLVDGLLVFQCNRLGYFGLMQRSEPSQDVTGSPPGKSRFCHPAVYVGSFFAVATLTASVACFVACYPSIRMPEGAKHCLVNVWLAMDLLCIAFTAGIHRTGDSGLCACVGVLLHYLSLSALLWMCVGAWETHKRVSRANQQPGGEDEMARAPPRKLGLYLVGWGVGLIVCGVSAAVNKAHYAGHHHCFLSQTPAISAVLFPAAVLLVYVVVTLLTVRCEASNRDTNRQLSEATENVDIELLTVPERSSGSISTHGSSEDLERSPVAQSRAQATVLCLFCAAWTAGALATTGLLPHLESVFASIYAVLASLLGAFVLFFHCLSRGDVRKAWSSRKPGRCCRTRSVSDTNPVPLATDLVADSRHSVANSISHHTDKSSRTNRSANAAKAAIELNRGAIKGDQSESDLIALHRRQYRSAISVATFTERSNQSGADVFYDPRQSTAARRFFRKQRRHRDSRGLGDRRRGDGGGGETDPGRPRSEAGGYRSSTLPLVERSREPPLERLVIGAEGDDPFVARAVVIREDKSLSRDIDVTSEGERDLAELAAEFHAIEEEMRETREKEAKEISSPCHSTEENASDVSEKCPDIAEVDPSFSPSTKVSDTSSLGRSGSRGTNPDTPGSVDFANRLSGSSNAPELDSVEEKEDVKKETSV